MIYYDDKDIVDQMIQILGIKQADKEKEEKRIWYTLGLKRQYFYEIKALLPETFDQAKQLALIVEARMKGVKKEVKNVVSNRDTNELSKSEINKI
ncbi:14308_t:CDS:2, partial [Gigaspora margarita]